jgi:hypothetical protein
VSLESSLKDVKHFIVVALDKVGNSVQERERQDKESQPTYMTVAPGRAATARTVVTRMTGCHMEVHMFYVTDAMKGSLFLSRSETFASFSI